MRVLIATMLVVLAAAAVVSVKAESPAELRARLKAEMKAEMLAEQGERLEETKAELRARMKEEMRAEMQAESKLPPPPPAKKKKRNRMTGAQLKALQKEQKEEQANNEAPAAAAEKGATKEAEENPDELRARLKAEMKAQMLAEAKGAAKPADKRGGGSKEESPAELRARLKAEMKAQMLAEAKEAAKPADTPGGGSKEASPAEMRAQLKAEMKAQMLAEAQGEAEACAAPLESAREGILTMTDPAAVLALMQEYPADVELQTKGCATVRKLADGGPGKLNAPFGSYSKRDLDTGVVAALVSAMVAHPTEDTLQMHAINALWVLSRNDDNANLIGQDSEDGAEEGPPTTPIELTVAAMVTHIDSAQIITHGCTLWNNLANRFQDISDAVIIANGIEAAVAGMEKHAATQVLLSQQCCMGLRNIANWESSDDMNPGYELATAGGVKAVLGAMRAHPDHAGVQTHGVAMLRNIIYRLQQFNVGMMWAVVEMMAEVSDVEQLLATAESSLSEQDSVGSILEAVVKCKAGESQAAGNIGTACAKKEAGGISGLFKSLFG